MPWCRMDQEVVAVVEKISMKSGLEGEFGNLDEFYKVNIIMFVFVCLSLPTPCPYTLSLH